MKKDRGGDLEMHPLTEKAQKESRPKWGNRFEGSATTWPIVGPSK